MVSAQERQDWRDAALGRELLAELDWNALVDASGIGIAVENGVVIVVGTVANMAEQTVVLETIESVVGEHDVINRVEVAVDRVVLTSTVLTPRRPN